MPRQNDLDVSNILSKIQWKEAICLRPNAFLFILAKCHKKITSEGNDGNFHNVGASSNPWL